MRDKRFVAIHRGGPLSREAHGQLIKWAHDCVSHVLPHFSGDIDDRLNRALTIAKAWENGQASVGDARAASLQAIAVANESSTRISIAIARAVGHAVATAHMADHSLRAADYALKAIKAAGKSIEKERKWQDEHLPLEVMELVLSARSG
ncbi:hypothetical protein SAMN05421820_103683 [Pedobacter steynii]|uniref:Imm-5-like domain-containing protein n=1 Tax=Pedobacter steynii TaxID=430522 RepID=A0A1G9SRQ1_9SPHI|nr:hypothetical protein [Pedobacter steynii]NQX37342.1 hypothetical protein [Pedobacter steynii]SDM38027.1 hypothetical protein SAMN05421820_103683 [Pedobacter steynii]